MGSGFGDSFLTPTRISVQHGTWAESISDQSSNYREFLNVVDAVKAEGKLANLQNAFLLFATNNKVVEAALYKGTADSPKLLQLVKRFHLLEMEYGFKEIVLHVAGTRQIAQGSDGLSRGALNEGIMKGADFLTFLDFHRSAVERSTKLLPWVKSWFGNCELLTPKDWFTRGHDIDGGAVGSDNFWRPRIRPSRFVWSPPPWCSRCGN